jgi:uncharacterized membrane protein
MLKNVKEYFTHEEKKVRDNRWIFTSMLVGAIFSLLAAFVLSVESIEIAKNPDAKLSCSVNLILNCATVAAHPTSTMFGFPNPFLGLMTEPIVITVAIAGLAGVRFPRLFMFTAQVFYTLGLLFALFLLYTSMFVIGALCPWCLLVTLTTILVWFAMTRYNLREDNLYLPKKWSKKAHDWLDKDYDKFAMAVIIFGIIAGIVLKYGDGLFA